MKTKGRPWQFFVVAILIFLFAYSAFFGIKSQYGDTLNTWIKGAAAIRFGIDIRGGVDVTFMPCLLYTSRKASLPQPERRSGRGQRPCLDKCGR